MNLKTIREFLIVLGMICVFTILIISLNSCEPQSAYDKNKRVNYTHEVVFFHIDGWCDFSRDIYLFEYKGHKYIQFGDHEYQTIVHDPDCPCRNKKTETSNGIFEW